MSTTAPRSEAVNWYDDEIAHLNQETTNAYNTLHAALVHDVQPADLIIGGRAVSDHFAGNGSCTVLDLMSGADVTLEHWSSDGDTLVRLAKNRNDITTLGHGRMLARQVRGTGDWMPQRSARRTTHLAALAAASLTLAVETFDAPEIDMITDRTFRTMRDLAGGQGFRGNTAFRSKIWVNSRHIVPLDKPDITQEAEWNARYQYGVRYIAAQTAGKEYDDEDPELFAILDESLKVQAATRLTTDEISAETQRIIDKKVGKLRYTAAFLGAVVPIVRDGKRLRPSRPQHRIHLRPRL